jgi:hypothetical protein
MCGTAAPNRSEERRDPHEFDDLFPEKEPEPEEPPEQEEAPTWIPPLRDIEERPLWKPLSWMAWWWFRVVFLCLFVGLFARWILTERSTIAQDPWKLVPGTFAIAFLSAFGGGIAFCLRLFLDFFLDLFLQPDPERPPDDQPIDPLPPTGPPATTDITTGEESNDSPVRP